MEEVLIIALLTLQILLKLMVRKLWYAHDLEETVESLFRIPQMRQQFDGFAYDGEMRPRGIKICSRYWPADAILDRLPEAVVIYLNVDEKHFPMLFDRMLKRDLSKRESKGQEKIKVKKIEERLKYAKRELEELINIRKTALRNPKSRIFNITNDESLYKEVIPYIKKLL